MKNGGFFITNIFFSLIKRIYYFLPSLTKMKAFLCNAFSCCKEEILSIRRKSKNLLVTNLDLGLYHLFNGNVEDAKLRFQLIKIFRPNLADVHYNLGRCYIILQRTEKAISSFMQALTVDPKFEPVIYYLYKIQDPEKVSKIPRSVISQYFNYVSAYFIDYWLVAKQYRGHKYIGSLIVNFYSEKLSDATILDLGCGTGICTQFLKNNNIGNHCIGVDISENMLAISDKCLVDDIKVYDQLINEDIVDFLNNNQEMQYDIILLSEVLHYIGDLTVVFQLIRKVINDSGLVVGVVRRQNYRNSRDFSFVPEGDFFHYSEDYIVSTAKQSGFSVVHTSYCKIYGNQVDGLLFALKIS